MTWLILALVLTFQQGVDGYAGCQDTYTLKNHPETNYVDAIYIEVIKTESNEGRVYIDFEGLPLTGVLACTLSLYCYYHVGADMTIGVYECSASWDAESVVWVDVPELDTIRLVTSIVGASPAWHHIPLPYWPEHGIALVCEQNGCHARSYRSSDMFIPHQRPVLIVELTSAGIDGPATTWSRIKGLYR